jgi:hypothetical protein
VPVSLFAKQVSCAFGCHPSLLHDFSLLAGGPSEYPSNPYGCYIRKTKNLLAAVSYGILLYSGLGRFTVHAGLEKNADCSCLVTMSLSIYFGVRNYWTMRDNPLIRVFYRDGTFYFIVLAGQSYLTMEGRFVQGLTVFSIYTRDGHRKRFSCSASPSK